VATISSSRRFDDDSIATISYVTDGNRRFPKETFRRDGGGRSARLDNFKAATAGSAGAAARNGRRSRSTRASQAQLDQFVAARAVAVDAHPDRVASPPPRAPRRGQREPGDGQPVAL